jgi:NADPH:quinone reductase-like Zn-dependent oxidoreductase
MKAVLQPAYGSPEVLRQADVDRPVIHDDGVLVKVIAGALNKGDWLLLTGKPYLLRAAFGLRKPTQPIPGMAMAGRVEAVGRNVDTFQVGDEVFGEINRGGFAEYVCVTAKEVAHKPARLSFEEAAALPVAATTALQGLRDAGKLQPGQSVLINGAAGGVGTFAVQIAKALGAEVTGVCSAPNVELVRSIGADHVIDYGRQDFTRGDCRYDVIFDLVGNQPLSACRRVLTERGRFVASAGGAENAWIGPMFLILTGLASNLFSSQAYVSLMARPNKDDLVTLCGLVDAGRVNPVIDRRYPLEELPEAMRHLGRGHSRGKSVITV